MGLPAAFDWHERPGAFERLAPPWQSVRVVDRTGTIHDGDRLTIELRLGPLRKHWVAVHEQCVPGRRFVDRQERGPFAEWVHTHSFFERDGGSRLEDTVEYRLPFGRAGELVGGRLARRRLDQLFAFRHRRLVHDLGRHAMTDAPRRIGVTGASGLIGSSLTAFLSTGGHEVVKIARGSTDGLDGLDAVVHLAGEPIGHRWSAARKQEIMRSREEGTRTLATALARLDRPPAVMVSASAVGIYGSRGDEILTEESSHGSDFLAGVCERWEAASRPAAEAGIRVANLRFGVVLEALVPRLLTPFKLGLGGRLGGGGHWLSWVALDDLLGAVGFTLADDRLSGPVNVTSPEPVTNRLLTKTLGAVVNRPTLFAVPAVAVSAVFGEMGRSMLLASQRALPQRLHAAGYTFAYPGLEDALRHVLGRTDRS